MSGETRKNIASVADYYGRFFAYPWQRAMERKHRSAKSALALLAFIENLICIPGAVICSTAIVAYQSIKDKAENKELHHEDHWCVKRPSR